MFDLLQPPGRDAAELLIALGRRYQFDVPMCAGGWVCPGGALTVLRLNAEGPVFQELCWSSAKPIHRAGSAPVLNGCLVPVAQVVRDGEALVTPEWSPIVLLAATTTMTSLGPGEVSLVVPEFGPSQGLPLALPKAHWLDWLRPDRDVREQHRPGQAQWRLGRRELTSEVLGHH